MNPYDMPQSLLEAARFFADEKVCHDFLASIRWPLRKECPHCQSNYIGALTETSAKSRSKKPNAKPIVRRFWTCKACRKQFTVKTGTIFEDSALPLGLWFPALWTIVNAKNGVSSCELARSLNTSQKTAWFMLHRIRLAMKTGTFPMKGTVEVDEVFIGPRAATINAKRRSKIADIQSGAHQTPVLGLIQRKTEDEVSKVQLHIVKNTQRKTLMPHILRQVQHGASVYTDGHFGYTGLIWAYDHQIVNHAIEYARGKIHTNTIENFWSVLRRTFSGTYVQMSNKHIIRYLDEQATRFNERGLSDLGRFLATLRRVIGRRLTYGALVAEPVSGSDAPALP